MMMLTPSQFRSLCVVGLLVIAAMLGFAMYLEHEQGLEPCPLCMAQRVAFVFLAAALLPGLLLPSRRWARGMTLGLAGLFALAGAGVAGRQVWLQHLPADQVPSCSFGLDFMLDAFPLWEVIWRTLQGTGQCAEVQWRFLGLSIPEWTLLVFVAFCVAVLLISLARPKPIDNR